MAVRPPLARHAPDDMLAAVRHEMLQESVASLSGAGRRLKAALAALEMFDATPDGEASAREALLAAAGDRLWHYAVQREMMGLRMTEALMREFGVPPEVRSRMGIMR